MKKGLIFGGLVLIGLVACKKDRVCECTIQNMPAADKQTQSFTLVDVSKKTAKNACIHSQSTYTAPNSKGVVETYTTDINCELK